MTARAPDAFIHMDLMIEINVVRQIMHPDPLNRSPRSPALPHRLQQIGVRPDLRVAVDAGLGRRNARVRGLLHLRMAVLALQSEPFNVVLVAERYRLVWPLALPRHPR